MNFSEVPINYWSAPAAILLTFPFGFLVFKRFKLRSVFLVFFANFILPPVHFGEDTEKSAPLRVRLSARLKSL